MRAFYSSKIFNLLSKTIRSLWIWLLMHAMTYHHAFGLERLQSSLEKPNSFTRKTKFGHGRPRSSPKKTIGHKSWAKVSRANFLLMSPALTQQSCSGFFFYMVYRFFPLLSRSSHERPQSSSMMVTSLPLTINHYTPSSMHHTKLVVGGVLASWIPQLVQPMAGPCFYLLKYILTQ